MPRSFVLAAMLLAASLPGLARDVPARNVPARNVPARDVPARNIIASLDAAPESLSSWQLFERRGAHLAVARGVVPYDLNTPLFSDYAHKWRTITVPKGTAIEYADGGFRFPVGTIISKTFYYPLAAEVESRGAVAKSPERSAAETLDVSAVRLIETRLLVHTRSGWLALPYIWNEAQTDATLELAGELLPLELVDGTHRESFVYSVPDVNQCSACHGRGEQTLVIEPIGVKPRHLDKPFAYRDGEANQLAHWHKAGLIEADAKPRSVQATTRWTDERAALADRARAYLDVNCAHCHNAAGGANTAGLFLDAGEHDPLRLGVCKIPIASGRGSGTGSFDIVPGKADESILIQRMRSREPDIAMPEIGRALVHREGVALIEAWIDSLAGSCEQ